MAGSKVSFSYQALGDEILRADFMVEHMKDRAERVKDEAEVRAPVYDGTGYDPHRGRYKDSFRVEARADGGARGNRAEGKVINDDPTAGFIEFGTRAHTAVIRGDDGRDYAIKVPAMPARHILGSAMNAAAGDE